MKILLLLLFLPVFGMSQQLVKTDDYTIFLEEGGQILTVIKDLPDPYHFRTSKYIVETVRKGNGFKQYHMGNGQSLLIEDTLFHYCYLWDKLVCDTVHIIKDKPTAKQ